MKHWMRWTAVLPAAIAAFAAVAADGQETSAPPDPVQAGQMTADASRPRTIATDAIAGFGGYTYDGAGNIISIGDAQGKDLFTYDNFGRLQTSAVRNAPAQTYTYDQWGNIRTITTAGDPVVQKLGVKNETNQITEAFDAFGQPNNVVGIYDGRGNLTSYNSGSMAYDGVEMMKESTVDGVRRFYVYSASDERVVTIRRVGSTNVGSDWTIRDAGGRVLRRLTESGGNLQWTSDYIYRDQQLLATAVPGPEKVRHFHVDHLGTPRLITGNGGVQVAEHHYQPFGRELPSSTNDGEKAKFTGHERDAATLDYMHARFYDPYIGRFMSVDPKGTSGKPPLPQTWNRYSYARNNPQKYIDPNGEDVYIVVTSTVVGDTRVNSRPGGKGVNETVPAYKIVTMSDAGYVDQFAGSRDTNYAGKTMDTRGSYGSNHEAPPGTYYGKIRTDGKLGTRVELSDTKGGSSIKAPDGTVRNNIQIHVGPGCSQGCVLLTGGKQNRDAFIDSVKFMQEQEREAGRSDQLHVIVQERNATELAADHCELTPE